MALKIGGNTVIDDSRNLVNVGGLKTVGGQSLLGTGDITAGAVANIFWENNQTVTANYTITAGKNAGTFGPISINAGVTVTVSDGSSWTIV